MGLVERLQYAILSPLGAVFFGLLLVLVLLTVVYWALGIRQRRRDYYSYLHQAYYKNAETCAKELRFFGPHRTDFFGRQTAVQFPDGSYGHCLIPPPDLADTAMRNRFRAVRQAVQSLPVFAPYGDYADNDSLIIVQKQTLRSDGRPLLGIRQLLADKHFTLAEREQLLLKLARALARLHDQIDEDGCRLYHGFLLPRTGLIHLEADGQFQDLLVTDVGIAFALGPERICHRLDLMRAGKLPMDRFCSHELLEQSVFLAPEQRSLKRLSEVGCAADIYSFGALAVSLFGHKRMIAVEQTHWDQVPPKWQPFIKACLEDQTANRPKDCREIEDWLSDPELALMHTEESVKFRVEQSVSDDLKILKDRVYQIDTSSNTIKFEEYLQAGQKALKTAKWEVAKKSFKQALRMDPNHPTANVNLAIALYELGDIKDSEKHVKVAQSRDPFAAKRFRQHIAFRL